MFSSQFDDNPFAEDMEVEKSPTHNSESVTSSKGNANNNSSNKKIPSSSTGKEEEEGGEEEDTAVVEPQFKVARLEYDAMCNTGDSPSRGYNVAAVPCIGYSLEDEGERDADDDESFNVHLSRLAELEATLKQLMHTHKFHLALGEEKNAILRVHESHLRNTARKLEERQRRKIQEREMSTLPAAAITSSNKEVDSQIDNDPFELVTLMEVYNSATELEIFGMHVRFLQYMETVQAGVREKHHNGTISEYENWMPTSPPIVDDDDEEEEDNTGAEYQSSPINVEMFDAMHSALEKLLPALDPKLAQLVGALMQVIQQLREKIDVLSDVKRSLASQFNALSARWSTYALWCNERSLLTAEQQMHSHLACVQPTSAEQRQFYHQRQLQKQLHRTEVAVATLLATAAGVHLRTVTPAALHNALQRYQQLEELKELLSREVLYLRKLLREKLTSSPLVPLPLLNGEIKRGTHPITGLGAGASPTESSTTTTTTTTADEGRLYLLQHCCAVLAQQLKAVTEKIISTIMRNSTACSLTAEQHEQILEYEAKVSAQHSSLVTCIKENARLQQQIRDASLIRLFAPPSSPALELLAEKLQMLSRSKHLMSSRDRNDDVEGEEEDYNYNEENEEGEENDLQKPILSVFTEQTRSLVQLFNAQLHGLGNIFKDEKQLCKEIAFLLRISVTADRLLLGKVGVPFPTNSSLDITTTNNDNSNSDENNNTNYDDNFTLCDACKQLDEAHISLGMTASVLQELPSVDELSATLQSQSCQHRTELAQRRGVAEKAHEELQGDLDWCRQQSPRTAAAELCEVQKELQSLRNMLALTAAHEKESAELESELENGKKHLAGLQRDMLRLREDMDAAEAQWSLLKKEQEEDRNALPTLVTEADGETNQNENSHHSGEDDNFNGQDENV